MSAREVDAAVALVMERGSGGVWGNRVLIGRQLLGDKVNDQAKQARKAEIARIEMRWGRRRNVVRKEMILGVRVMIETSQETKNVRASNKS